VAIAREPEPGGKSLPKNAPVTHVPLNPANGVEKRETQYAHFFLLKKRKSQMRLKKHW